MSQDIEEYQALTSTLSGFYNYHQWETQEIVEPKSAKYASLTKQEHDLIPWFPKYIEDLKMCISMNQEFTQKLAVSIAQDWGVSSDPRTWAPASENEYDKVRSTLLQYSREWSSEGENELKVSYFRIVDELKQMFPDVEKRQNVKILNPGCGLGRLVLELVKQGFWCQGNEFSYHMLLASNFVLNHCRFTHNYSLFPYLHKSSYLTKRLHQTRPVTIPNVNPVDLHHLAEKNPGIPYADLMSMTAGSFVDLYGPDNINESSTYTNDPVASEFRATNKETFDVVVTAFFLDTASNVIEYLKTIYSCLKEDGVWINFGPLLWHFEDDKSTNESGPLRGLELSRDDLVELVEKFGFVFEKRESGIETTYSADTRALGSFVYKCEYWVARKHTGNTN